MTSDILSILYVVITILFSINAMLAFFIVFFGRRNPTSTWVWLMVLVILPFFGFIIYLLFGQDIKKSGKLHRKGINDRMLRQDFFDTVNDGIYRKKYDYQIKAFKARNVHTDANDFYTFSLSDLAFHNMQVDGGILTGDNDITIYNTGEDKFAALKKDLKDARKYIHMQYYIINNDELGREIVDILAAKAKEGVEVKFIYDGMGCMHNGRGFFKPITRAGGVVTNFLPPVVPPVNIRVNYRNHRKIAVIDGELGYLGGINIGDEYMGKVKKFGFWRDMHLRITGSAVDQLQLRFIMDWNFASPHRMSLLPLYFPLRPNDDFDKTYMQIVSSGPDTEHSNIKNLYFKMMNEAEKSIYFETPYFVPDDSILAALKVAALSGIDVRLIFPGKPDHPFVYWASLSYVSELLAAGVKCYQYEKGFIHSKMMVVDGTVSSVGTANMDIRSFSLNFETNAVIYSEQVAKQLQRQFYEDQGDSTEITLEWYNKRSNATKVKEAFSRLISPLL